MPGIRGVLLALAVLATATTIAAAVPDAVTIFQKDRKFSADTVTVAVGQRVTFTNRDNVAHNVYSQTPGMQFDLRLQAPGDSSTVTFDRAGEVDVFCAIHPQMKMKIIVTPP